MRKFLLWFGIMLVVIITIWLRGTYIEYKINKSIEAYGIPKAEITKTKFGYSFTSGFYRKRVWTKQDGEEGREKNYIFEYRHRRDDMWHKKVMLAFGISGFEWPYDKLEADMQEFHDFLEENNWSFYYYPAPNPEVDLYWEW